MPDIVSDIVDVYVFRRLNARVQFLLLQRKAEVPLGNTWQSISGSIVGFDSSIETARRIVREATGLNVSDVWSADFVNEFYDASRDVIVLAPVFAVNVRPQAPITLSSEFREAAWWDTNQAIARLPFAGQRWAARHIDEIMGAGHAESELYRVPLDGPAATPRFDDAVPAVEADDPIDVEPAAESTDDDAEVAVESGTETAVESSASEDDSTDEPANGADESDDASDSPDEDRTDVPNRAE